jgi:hypothetical protein
MRFIKIVVYISDDGLVWSKHVVNSHGRFNLVVILSVICLAALKTVLYNMYTICILYVYVYHTWVLDWMIGFVDTLHTLQFTVTHALAFSVLTSRILTTDLSQSHCNFNHT